MPRCEVNDIELIKYLSRRGYEDDEIKKIYQNYGIKVCYSGYYKTRLIIPIHDSQGELVTFEAVHLHPNGLEKDEKKKLYPKGTPRSRLLFNNHRVDSDYVFLTEGILDAIKLSLFGVPSVAILGSLLSDNQARMLISKFNKVFILFDGDKAGRDGSYKAQEKLSPFVDVLNIKLRYGDPNDLKYWEFKEMKDFLIKMGNKRLENYKWITQS